MREGVNLDDSRIRRWWLQRKIVDKSWRGERCFGLRGQMTDFHLWDWIVQTLCGVGTCKRISIQSLIMIMIVTSNFSIIDHFSSDLLTNCTTGGSIPPWPVLSPSITETSKDHRVHKEQAANNGKHDQDVVEKCHHCFCQRWKYLVPARSPAMTRRLPAMTEPSMGSAVSTSWFATPKVLSPYHIILNHHIGRF